MSLMGASLAALTGSAAANAATWGPDVRLAFARSCDVYVAHPSGTPIVNVTPDTPLSCEYEPSLSRTGRYVAYKKGVDTWLYDFADRTHRVLVSGPSSAPDFSPVTDAIAYARYVPEDRVGQLFSLKVDGTGLRQWTNDVDGEDHYSLNPQWSGDGQDLVYTRAHGTRTCRVDRGGFDEVHHAQRLARITGSGTITTVAGDNTMSIHAGQEAGGTLAYVHTDLPATDARGYCATPPTNVYELTVNGRTIGAVSANPPSVAGDGDVAYTRDMGVWVVPDGSTVPQRLFEGQSPDWGVAYAGDPTACTITGTKKPDRLVGTDGADVICGGGKSDVLLGMGGDDVLRGGSGEDKLAGGQGTDSLDGGEDDDALRGDEGDDVLSGGPGTDLVTYFSSTSTVTVDLGAGAAAAGPHGDDTLSGIEGAFGSKTGDLLLGDSSDNQLYGGPGTDVVEGAGGFDLLHGNAGADKLVGGGGGDLLYGEGGADDLRGGPNKDICYDADATGTSCEFGVRAGVEAGAGAEARATAPVSAERVGFAPPDSYYLGNGDYLTVYNTATTQHLGGWAALGTADWEREVCGLLRYTPAKAACKASGAIATIEKWQLHYFLTHAKRLNDCAVAVMDYGRHGVNQLKKRWKARPATYYRHNVNIPSLTPGRYTEVKVSDPEEVGAAGFRITCQ